ncbi:MAG: ribonuclease [Bacillales bacterium]|jgi:ribonuclease J|nr:ribonuclease [Bacillales bacterium]
MHHQIKIIPLGGVSELGKNMFLVEVDKKIFVLDAGIMYPETEMLGIDFVIPDIQYLVENKNRIQGIFLSHGHEDHIGALPYMVEDLDVPIYATKLTLELAKANISQTIKNSSPNCVEIDKDSILEFGNITVSFFQTNHSIPGSVGIVINTKDGAIVYTGDFKFDQSAKGIYQAEIGKIASIGEKGVLCLISECNGAEKPGFTISESIVSGRMNEQFFHAKGRIIVACFASNIAGLQHVFNAAKANNRKIAILGRRLETVYNIAMELGFLEVDNDIIISVNQAQKLPHEQVVILTTGDQGAPFKALQRMVKGSHRMINISSEDTVLIAASPMVGSELLLSKTVNLLTRLGANVVFGPGKIHVSGNGSQEELKMMINLTRPEYVVPVHGDFKQMMGLGKMAESLGIDPDKIPLLENGEILEIGDGFAEVRGKVASGNVLIDGIGVGDVGGIVLRDRKTLSQDGVVIVTATISRQTKTIIAGPEVISKGFVFVRESEELIIESKSIVKKVIEKRLGSDQLEWSAMKNEVRENLHSYLFDKTKRRPLILPIIMEVK